MTINTIITGAGSGLGQALALNLDGSNRNFFLIDTSIVGLQKTKELIGDVPVELFELDITKYDSVEACIQTIGDIHELFNCAGVSVTGGALDLSLEHWQTIVSINILGTIHISTLVARRMKEQGTGTIVNIASMFGFLPAPSGVAYSTTKHAVVGFSRTLSIEMNQTGVSVHLVVPGFIRTNLFENSNYVGVQKEDCEPDTSNMLSADQAARRIIHGIRKNKRVIVFPFYVRILRWIDWMFPSLTFRFWQEQWKKFSKL